ncbi:MAG TPA: DUF59 domain-containing protein [Planctomycetota bacterium]|jgi:FeS assembly SUF system protein|nr:DUF59 domain-containing protein [Planctomycetota bacterium]
METKPTIPPSPPDPRTLGNPPAPTGAAPSSTGGVRDRAIEAIRQVYDPEIPVNIYEIGLIYGVEADDAGAVRIRMTLTSPSCPSAEMIPLEVEERVKAVPGVSSVKVDVVWEPPWTPEKMSEAAKLQLGFS